MNKEVDLFIYVNLLVNQAFNKSQDIIIKTLPQLHISIPEILYISNLTKTLDRIDFLNYLIKYDYTPLNKIEIGEAIYLDEPLVNIHLKKISIEARYVFSPYQMISTDIIGTGMKLTITRKDLLKGIYSCKKFLQYQKPEYIHVDKINNYTNFLQFVVIYSPIEPTMF